MTADTPRMGGNPTLRLFLQGGEDVAGALDGFADALQEAHRGAFRPDLVRETGGRSDLLLQQLEQPVDPAELASRGLAAPEALDAQFRSRLWDAEPDVVVLSIRSEVAEPLWRHREQGYLFCPPEGGEGAWSAPQREWFEREFEPLGLVPTSRFEETLTRLVQAIKERLRAHVLVFNVSTVDPADGTYNHHGAADTLTVRAHEFDLALMRVSTSEGISIIDIDRLVAQSGADRHVTGALRYSPELHRAACEEVLRVLADIGFFENRPLVMQVGQRGRAAAAAAHTS